MGFTSRTSGLTGSLIRALDLGQRRVTRATERLASGLRVRSAADDAAGLAVAEGLGARVTSRQRAQRNISEGVSMLQTAEGGMAEVAAILGRVRELALQSANGTYGTGERELIQQEVAASLTAIDETTGRCKLGDRCLLRGNAVDVAFLVDSSASMGGEIATLRASVDAFRDRFRADSISVQLALVESSSARDPGDTTARRADIGDGTFGAALDALTLAGASQDQYAVLYNATGLDDTPGTVEPDTVTFRAGAVKRLIFITDTNREMAVPGIDPSEANLASALAAEGFVLDVIGAPGTTSPVVDSIVAATGGSFYSLGDGSGSNIPTALGSIADEVTRELGGGVTSMEIQAGVDAEDRIRLGLPVNLSAAALGVSGIDVSTADGALEALAHVDQAIGILSEARSSLGASQNALQMATEAHAAHIESETAARSRITDADFAEEASELTSARIVLEGTTALTAQASRLDQQRILFLLGIG